MNNSNGDHFGEIMWSSVSEGKLPGFRYYDGKGEKLDGHIYAKIKKAIGTGWITHADVQLRHVDYDIVGTNNELQNLNTGDSYVFLNPKIGISYNWDVHNFYASISLANREPVRSDFESVLNGKPRSEFLKDYEIGWRYDGKWDFEINGYLMDYENQLVPNGELNDVGAIVRVNVDDSYRLGIEVSSRYKINEKWSLSGNVNMSRNKIKQIDHTIYDYTNGFDVITKTKENTNIALSPSILANASIQYKPINNLSLEWRSKYAGDQFLDNTANENRKIDAFQVNDLFVSWEFQPKFLNRIQLDLGVYNVLNAKYSTFGYTYSYIFGTEVTENFYYPQATRHFLVGVTIDF
jgi:iron complex outermembrane receptor protein